MTDYTYTLIRFVADPNRMEPINAGIILQGAGRSDFQLNPHIAKKKDVDTPVWRKWRDFFEQEIRGDPVPLFQPQRDVTQFIQYLANLCQGPVVLSRPLALSVASTRSFDDVLSGLMTDLVLPPVVTPAEDQRATGRFRRIAKTRRFQQRGLRRYEHVDLPAGGHGWRAYRQVLNGQHIAIDKIEVGRELGLTATEMDKLAGIIQMVKAYLQSTIEGRNTRYVLLADDLTEPFTDQTDEEFEVMRRDLSETAEQVAEIGGEVLRVASDSERFALDLDQRLPANASVDVE